MIFTLSEYTKLYHFSTKINGFSQFLCGNLVKYVYFFVDKKKIGVL